MSIWSSVGKTEDLERIPGRCTYTGLTEPTDSHPLGHEVDTAVTYAIDVATATLWHDCVRLCVDEWREDRTTRAVEVMLNPTEVQLLIQLLAATVPVSAT